MNKREMSWAPSSLAASMCEPIHSLQTNSTSSTSILWPGADEVVRALDKRLERSRVQTWADPLSGNNLGQVVHTHVPLSPSSQGVMVPCGREGNRKSVYDEIENVIFSPVGKVTC